MNFYFNSKCAGTLILMLLSLVITSNAMAGEIFGVTIADTVNVANQDLKLNGAGVRTKFSSKYAVASLYLREPKATTEEIIAEPGPKRLTEVLMQSSTSDRFAEGFMSGIRNNASKDERSKVIPSMLKFGQIFSAISDVKKGDVWSADWVPGTGIVFQVNGRQAGEAINDPLFYSMFLRIWLGDHPLDSTLKRALLNAH
jgi:hypothetical protein